MKEINKYGQTVMSSNDLRDLILQGRNISHLYVSEDEETELYQKFQSSLLPDMITFLDTPEESLSIDDFHNKCAGEWIFPIIYQNVDVHLWLLDKCNNETEVERVNEEYILYAERDLIMLLRFFIYFIDHMRKNKFVWGVGRGSSVSSFILYLIGVHRVNSIKYNLSISDYLK